MGNVNGYDGWLGAYVNGGEANVDGLLSVSDFTPSPETPSSVVSVMEKADAYKADAVFFQAVEGDGVPIAQAFVYHHDSHSDFNDEEFAALHQRLWSWGEVPLIYRVVPGAVHLFRCRHKPDFEQNGEVVYRPHQTLNLAALIASDDWWAQQDPWWDWQQLHSGALWDDPRVCETLLSGSKAAHRTLIDEVKKLYVGLSERRLLPKPLQRRLLILSILIAYLEERGVFEEGFFAQFGKGAGTFHDVLADGNALVELLESLEKRFNGHVFSISDKDKAKLTRHRQLARFARFVRGHHQADGQMTLWKRYSFADLPVELISHIYQLFVEDKKTAVYTPHFLVRLMVDEALDQDRLDRLVENNEVVLDPACGSGIFLVEVYKRLVLHWRKNNDWAPLRTKTLKRILKQRIRGIDLERNAAELTAFSLCLAMCDALSPKAIRRSVRLFPELLGKSIHSGCFFEAIEEGKLDRPVGLILGNPPFASTLKTDGAKRARLEYEKEYGNLPDKQIGYLFLHGSMATLEPAGRMCLLQHYGFLYNKVPVTFRQRFLRKWNVREVLDFVSITGLFGNRANTKVVCVIADAETPDPKDNVLHAVFRRSGRVQAQQGFDTDYYDLFWLSRQQPIENDSVWRCNLLGGGRVEDYVRRLSGSGLHTLGQYINKLGWNRPDEGWFTGNSKSVPADYITEKPYISAKHITPSGIEREQITTCERTSFVRPRTVDRYTPPILLIREHMDLACGVTEEYLTYSDEVVGICAPDIGCMGELSRIERWLRDQNRALCAYVACISERLFTRRATSITKDDILGLPFPESGDLEISPHEQILVDDIVDYYRDFVRLGESSAMMKEPGEPALEAFNEVFLSRVNGVYSDNPLRALPEQTWPGAICQPYIFGDGKVDWTGAEQLRGKLNSLLMKKRRCGLNVTRIAWLYDDACIYLLKPNRLRYWLRSIALRDSDEVLAEMEAQGF